MALYVIVREKFREKCSSNLNTDSRLSHIPSQELFREQAYEWHIGEDSPADRFSFGIDQVVCIQADCDEKAWIVDSFDNIPIPRFNVARWFGDTAKMIASHLRKYRTKKDYPAVKEKKRDWKKEDE
jgi:hypothetical protein